MKYGGFFLVLALLAFNVPTLAQETTSSTLRLKFYEKLAARDAQYEQVLGSSNAQDEMDYWNDQRDYERQLGKSNFTFYLVYMKGKKEAYKHHLQNCDNSCSHSIHYWSRAREYLSIPDSTDIFEVYPSKLVQSTRLKKRN
ncbi:hypothetical protein [Flagellimonas allohymeniacidonis]|uniref:Uncharacterized protein n=1 Tax=Flagellimonas allohymeniacidonis TaxID=2517819 RepID=A0A4V2HSC8_9FLAO|nr:hypothetical protein [Allomuricauda hymeniacidonis]TAI47260.1 hypothetical protein EW142_11290 [Allomuricauda hymeniacidonis]